MRTASLKLLAGLSLLGALVASAAISRIVMAPPLEPEDRTVLAWSPETGDEPKAAAAIAAPEGTAETFARPLFIPTRRPFVPPPPPPPPELEPVPVEPPPPPEPVAQLDPGQLSLKGVAIEKTSAKALVASPSVPEGQWVSQGAKVMEWTVAKIGEDFITLTAGAQTATLKLYAAGQPQ